MAQPKPPAFQPVHSTNTPSGQPLPPSKNTRANEEIAYQNNPFVVALDGISAVFAYAKSIGIILVVLSVLSVVGNAASSAVDVLHDSKDKPAAVSATDTSPLDDQQVVTLMVTVGVVLLAVSIVVFLIGSFLKGIGDASSAAASNQTTLSLKQAIAMVARRFPGYLLLQLLIMIKLILWSLLFFVPAIIMSVRYSLAGTAYFAREMKANEALKHSVLITKDAWFTTVASFGLFNLVTLGILSGLVQTSVQGILFRQFDAYQAAGKSKPGPHGLSIAFFILCILLMLLGLFLLFALLVFSFAQLAG